VGHRSRPAEECHLYGCKAARPYPPRDYDLPTAFRSSFNLVVALAIEFAAESDKSAGQLAELLRDAAAGIRPTQHARPQVRHPIGADRRGARTTRRTISRLDWY